LLKSFNAIRWSVMIPTHYLHTVSGREQKNIHKQQLSFPVEPKNIIYTKKHCPCKEFSTIYGLLNKMSDRSFEHVTDNPIHSGPLNGTTECITEKNSLIQYFLHHANNMI